MISLQQYSNDKLEEAKKSFSWERIEELLLRLSPDHMSQLLFFLQREFKTSLTFLQQLEVDFNAAGNSATKSVLFCDLLEWLLEFIFKKCWHVLMKVPLGCPGTLAESERMSQISKHPSTNSSPAQMDVQEEKVTLSSRPIGIQEEQLALSMEPVDIHEEQSILSMGPSGDSPPETQRPVTPAVDSVPSENIHADDEVENELARQQLLNLSSESSENIPADDEAENELARQRLLNLSSESEASDCDMDETKREKSLANGHSSVSSNLMTVKEAPSVVHSETVEEEDELRRLESEFHSLKKSSSAKQGASSSDKEMGSEDEQVPDTETAGPTSSKSTKKSDEVEEEADVSNHSIDFFTPEEGFDDTPFELVPDAPVTQETPSDEDDEERTNRQARAKLLEMLNDEVSSGEEAKEEEEAASKLEKAKSVASTSSKSTIASSSSEEVMPKPKLRSFPRMSVDDEDGSESSSSEKSSSDSSLKSVKRKTRGKGKASSSDREDFMDGSKSGKRLTDKRRKKKRILLDSSDEEADVDLDNESEEEATNKKIRKIMDAKQLSADTLTAEAEEKERRKRIAARQQKYNEEVVQEVQGDGGQGVKITKLVLEKDPLVEVHPHLISKLKSHQVEAVKFMWECVVESVERHKTALESEKDGTGRVAGGQGCVLAHCMGLGKTLSVIAFVHTLLTHQDVLSMRHALVICPVNTVNNWYREWQHWMPHDDDLYVVSLHEFAAARRSATLKHWRSKGGVLIIGYQLFRDLTTKYRGPKGDKPVIREALLSPGADIVVCDEGHLLKNAESTLTKAVSQIRTMRRIVLTGTPLQNNLSEYFTMVNFVKPNLLGTKKEFHNRFVNPINNGQLSTSTQRDVRVMKQRAHVLYRMLDGSVQRKDHSALTLHLPPKLEYLVRIRLTDVQRNLYQLYLDQLDKGVFNRQLFADQQVFNRIWTHPFVLRLHELKEEHKQSLRDEDDEDDAFIVSDSDSEEEVKPKSKKRKAATSSEEDCIILSDSDSREASSAKVAPKSSQLNRSSRRGVASSSSESVVLGQDKAAWWHELYEPEFQHMPQLSGKIMVLFYLLRKCSDIGDKVLVFSHSLCTLDLIERFLGDMHEALNPGFKFTVRPTKEPFDYSQFRSDVGPNTWVKGSDYERMDGSTNIAVRKTIQDRFNSPRNTRLRLFLISTKAGGLGINLVAANRAVIFDHSWNPSHDVQSVFRCYRFGQVKPTYIYRLLAQGTMEEKIYDRQITKQSLSRRVVDEHQIERYFTAEDLEALYTFEPDVYDPTADQERPNVPKDRMLGDLLLDMPDLIKGYHDHDSLLENKKDEELTEDERQEAWRLYEQEKQFGTYQPRVRVSMTPMSAVPMPAGLQIQGSSGSTSSTQSQIPTVGSNALYENIALNNYRMHPELHHEPEKLAQMINDQYRQYVLMQNTLASYASNLGPRHQSQ